MLSELDEWKQAASVEAGLRREFKAKADKFEAALRTILAMTENNNLYDAWDVAHDALKTPN